MDSIVSRRSPCGGNKVYPWGSGQCTEREGEHRLACDIKISYWTSSSSGNAQRRKEVGNINPSDTVQSYPSPRSDNPAPLPVAVLLSQVENMGETRDNDAYEEELLDYEEEEEKAPDSAAKANGEGAKKGYVGIHSSGFRDFLLKPELLRAIVDSGFEHPSE
ncbi:hypothetical protein CRG98_013579, partial [Punica granatum]